MGQIANTFDLSVNAASDNIGVGLDMFRRPVANVVFVVSQADTKSIIDGSLGGLVSQWQTRFGERVHKMIQGAESNDALYSIDSTKYSLLARSTDQSRVKNFLKQLVHFESELERTIYAENSEPSLSIVIFTAIRDLNPEEAVEARQLLQNQYLPKLIQKLNNKSNERVVAQVIYDDKLTNTNAVGRKLMAAYSYAVVNNNTNNNTNVTVPTANQIAEWQAAVWTCIILIFAGIFAVKFIMSIDYSADQVNITQDLLTIHIDDLCSRAYQNLLKYFCPINVLLFLLMSLYIKKMIKT
jgi:hypothetical protein